MKKFVAYGVLSLLYSLVLSSVLLGIILLVSSARADVTENLRASTMQVGNATGAIVQGKSGKHYILTNWHVCFFEGALKTNVLNYSTNKVLVWGKVVAYDAASDLCAAETSAGSALQITPHNNVKEVFTRGYPGGIVTESKGIVKKRIEWDYEITVDVAGGKCPEDFSPIYRKDGKVRSCTIRWTNLLTTLYSRPGSSGSPVLDDEGFLAGVMTTHDTTGNDFAGGVVPTEMVRAFLEQL